jgi:hypothetical protein
VNKSLEEHRSVSNEKEVVGQVRRGAWRICDEGGRGSARGHAPSKQHRGVPILARSGVGLGLGVIGRGL